MTTLGTVTEGFTTPIGEYVLELKAIRTEASKFSEGEFRNWIFKCLSVHHSDEEDADNMIGEEIWRATGTSLGLTSDGYAIVSALIGRNPDKGEAIEEDELIGRRVIGSVLPYSKKDGTKTTRLEAFRPFKAKPRKQAAEPDDLEF